MPEIGVEITMILCDSIVSLTALIMSLQEQIATIRNGLRLDRQSVEYYHSEGPVHRSWRSPNKLVTEYMGFKNAQELFMYDANICSIQNDNSFAWKFSLVGFVQLSFLSHLFSTLTGLCRQNSISMSLFVDLSLLPG